MQINYSIAKAISISFHSTSWTRHTQLCSPIRDLRDLRTFCGFLQPRLCGPLSLRTPVFANINPLDAASPI